AGGAAADRRAVTHCGRCGRDRRGARRGAGAVRRRHRGRWLARGPRMCRGRLVGGRASPDRTLTDAQSAPRFLVAEAFAPGTTITFGEDEVRHMRALRLGLGAQVLLLDGIGQRAVGSVRTIAKRNATVDVETVEMIEPLPAVHLLVPIAD